MPSPKTPKMLAVGDKVTETSNYHFSSEILRIQVRSVVKVRRFARYNKLTLDDASTCIDQFQSDGQLRGDRCHITYRPHMPEDDAKIAHYEAARRVQYLLGANRSRLLLALSTEELTGMGDKLEAEKKKLEE